LKPYPTSRSSRGWHLASLVLAVLVDRRSSPAAEPRFLLVNEVAPRAARQLAKPPFAARWANLLATADSFCKAPVAGFEKVRDAQGICGATAFAYVVTGKPEYAERARKEALALLAAPAWHQPKDWNKGAELSTAEASQACALVYDWCFDALTVAERAIFRDALLAKSTRVYLESIEKLKDSWVENSASNWCGVVPAAAGSRRSRSATKAPTSRAPPRSRARTNDFRGEPVRTARATRAPCTRATASVRRVSTPPTSRSRAAPRRPTPRSPPTQQARRIPGRLPAGSRPAPRQLQRHGEETPEGLFGDDPRKPEGGPSGELCALYEARVAGGDPLPPGPRTMAARRSSTKGAAVLVPVARRAAPARPELQPAVPSAARATRSSGSPTLWLALHAGFTSEKGHDQLDLGTPCSSQRRAPRRRSGYGVAATSDHSTLVERQDQKDVHARRLLRPGRSPSTARST
jgi:hypothetical protein